MHRKTSTRFLIAFAVVLALAAGKSRAQEGNPLVNSPKPDEQNKPVAAYHLDFALNELEDGKKINAREYAMDLIAEKAGENALIRDITGYNGKEIKIGTRVPIETEKDKYEYIDIGTKIWCRLVEDETWGLDLSARAELSSVVPNTGTDRMSANLGNHTIRQLQINASTVIIPGVRVSLGTADDPDSKHQFQLEVIVSKGGLLTGHPCTFYEHGKPLGVAACGRKEGDKLKAYCITGDDKQPGQSQDKKENTKQYQDQIACYAQ